MTARERAATGNGDMQEWIEYEAEANRDYREYLGTGDPDPKYDLAPMVAEQSFGDMVFIQQWRMLFDGESETNTADDPGT